MISFTSRLFHLRERKSGTQWVGGWVGHRPGLDVLKERNVSFPCRQSNGIIKCKMNWTWDIREMQSFGGHREGTRQLKTYAWNSYWQVVKWTISKEPRHLWKANIMNQVGIVCITYHCGAHVKSLLQWTCNNALCVLLSYMLLLTI